MVFIKTSRMKFSLVFVWVYSGLRETFMFTTVYCTGKFVYGCTGSVARLIVVKSSYVLFWGSLRRKNKI